MLTDEFIWPTDGMDFWKITNEQYHVTISWNKQHYENYRKLSYQYFQCGFETLCEIVRNLNNNSKTDMWFLASIYLLRQSIELGLKSIICRAFFKSNKQIQVTFENCKHNLHLLIETIKNTSEINYINSIESSWLVDYLYSLEQIDRNSEVFRFPFNEKFLEKYRDSYLDIIGIGNNILQAFCLVKKIIEKGKVKEGEEFDNKLSTDFILLTENGIGNCYLWQPITDDGFYVKINGFRYVAEFLFNSNSISNPDKCLPLLFVLRNTLELCLKRLLYCKVDIKAPNPKMFSKRKSHDLMELWKAINPILIQYTSSSDIHLITVIEKNLQFLNSIDRQGFAFRYPTTYSLQYVLNNAHIDIKNVFEYMISLINFFESCDMMLDSIADYQFEMKSYFEEY